MTSEPSPERDKPTVSAGSFCIIFHKDKTLLVSGRGFGWFYEKLVNKFLRIRAENSIIFVQSGHCPFRSPKIGIPTRGRLKTTK
jgi:hypothetical protein